MMKKIKSINDYKFNLKLGETMIRLFLALSIGLLAHAAQATVQATAQKVYKAKSKYVDSNSDSSSLDLSDPPLSPVPSVFGLDPTGSDFLILP